MRVAAELMPSDCIGAIGANLDRCRPVIRDQERLPSPGLRDRLRTKEVLST
jgi:hypothetical protein